MSKTKVTAAPNRSQLNRIVEDAREARKHRILKPFTREQSNRMVQQLWDKYVKNYKQI